MGKVESRRAADVRRRSRQPYRKLFDHIRQGCRQQTPKFSDRMVGILGYDYAAFRARMEETFVEGMTWELFLSGEIHIDHRKPLASFDPQDVREVRKAWALSNLQAMWPTDNLKKLKLDRALLAEVCQPRGLGTFPAPKSYEGARGSTLG